MAPKPRVFIVGPTESVLTHRGDRHPALARWLAELGHEVCYVTSDFDHAEKRRFSGTEIRQAKDRVPYKMRVIRSLGYKRNIALRRVFHQIMFACAVFVYLLNRARRTDTIILPSRPPEVMLAAGAVRMLKRARLILDVQDVWPDAFVVPSKLKETAFAAYCHALQYPAVLAVDVFVHICPSFKRWIHRYRPEARSTFLPLGFDPERWTELPAEDSSASDKKELVLVGQLQYQIDIMPVLKALVELNDWKLTIIGDSGTGQRYLEVREFIDRNNMSNVRMIGTVQRSEVPEMLKSMTIGIVPVISTLLPNKFFDYIAAGLPIMVVGCRDAARIVRRKDIGWTFSMKGKKIREFLATITAGEIREKRRNVLNVRHSYNRERILKTFARIVSNTSAGTKRSPRTNAGMPVK